jgi:hypothetical protein
MLCHQAVLVEHVPGAAQMVVLTVNLWSEFISGHQIPGMKYHLHVHLQSMMHEAYFPHLSGHCLQNYTEAGNRVRIRVGGEWTANTPGSAASQEAGSWLILAGTSTRPGFTPIPLT